jgi:ribosomal protein S6
VSEDRINFESIKDMDIKQLSKFLEKVWKAGFYTANLKGEIDNMPNFEESLKNNL